LNFKTYLYLVHFSLVIFGIAGQKYTSEFIKKDIMGEPGKTCHAFNYGIHLAKEFAIGGCGVEHFLASHHH